VSVAEAAVDRDRAAELALRRAAPARDARRPLEQRGVVERAHVAAGAAVRDQRSSQFEQLLPRRRALDVHRDGHVGSARGGERLLGGVGARIAGAKLDEDVVARLAHGGHDAREVRELGVEVRAQLADASGRVGAQRLHARARRPEELDVRRRHLEATVDGGDGWLVRRHLLAVADHALLDRHRLAAEPRDERLALLRLARDDARLAVVDDQQSDTRRRRAHRPERPGDRLLVGVQHEALPEGGDRRVGGNAPRRAQRAHRPRELARPHGRSGELPQQLVRLFGVGSAEGKEHRHLAEGEAARGARNDAQQLARHRGGAEGVEDASAEHVHGRLGQRGRLVLRRGERGRARVPRLVRRVPHARGALLHQLVQPRRHAVQIASEVGVRATAIAVHEGDPV